MNFKHDLKSFVNLRVYLKALIPIEKINDGLLIIRNSLPKNELNEDCPLCLRVLEYFMSQWMESNELY